MSEDLGAKIPLRVLLVEDDMQVSKVVRKILDLEGSISVVVESLAAAIEAAPDCDVVLLDLNLTDSRGIHTLRAMRASTDRPIVVMTAQGASEVELGFMAGAQDWIDKSDMPTHLSQRLRFAIVRDRVDRIAHLRMANGG